MMTLKLDFKELHKENKNQFKFIELLKVIQMFKDKNNFTMNNC